MSKHLGPWGKRGLLKLGQVVVPGDGILPSFRETTFAAHVDRMLDYMTDHDRDGLKLLLPMLAFVPKVGIRGLLILAEHNQRFPGPVGVVLRMLRFGLK